MRNVNRFGRPVAACVAALSLAFAAASCGKNTSEFDAAAATPSAAPVKAVVASPHGSEALPAPPAWTIRGTLEIAPELQGKVKPTDVVYVTARVPGERMPIAVARVPEPAFPVEYVLDPSHGMGSSADPAAGLEVSAHLSRSGTAGPAQPGDLTGNHDGPVQPGATNVTITIDTEI